MPGATIAPTRPRGPTARSSHRPRILGYTSPPVRTTRALSTILGSFMKKHLAVALVLPIALPLALAAVPFAAEARDSLGSYTYLEGGFSRVNVDNDTFEDLDIDGGYLRTSVALGESSLYLLGGAALGTNDDNGAEIDGREVHLGLGYHYTFADNVDLTVETVFTRQELNTDFADDTLNNTRLGVGVRGAFSNNFEGWVKANYVDGGAYDGDFVGTLGAQYVIDQTWGVVAEYDAGADISRFNIGVRASF